VSEFTHPLDGLSDETLDRLILQERAENEQARRERRERKAAAEDRRYALQQMVALGLRSVRSPDQVLAEYAAAGDRDGDANTQRCRAVFEEWLQNGGTVDRLRALLRVDL
jgi:hypothetical protein